MSYEYNGYELNEYLEEPWYATDQTAWTDVFDLLPDKGEKYTARHYHSYVASASNEANLAVSANNDGTVLLNQYTTDGIVQVFDSDGSVGVTGIAAEMVGPGNISEAELETLNGVETGIQAQINVADLALDKQGYFVDLGVTGLPYRDDGIIGGHVTHVGSAVVSTDGRVHLMREAGLTGIQPVTFCGLLTVPVPTTEDVKFAADVTDADEYSSLGFTGGGADDAELHIRARQGITRTTHLLVEARYGKLKLTTGAGAGGENGIMLVGADANGVNYGIAGAGEYRDLYVDENNQLVMGESDSAQRYKTAGFTGTISTTYFDTIDYPYLTYEISGDYVRLTIPEISANSVNDALRMSGLPSEIQPAINVNLPCIVRDQVNVPTGAYRPARASFFQSSDLVNFYPMSAEGSYWTYSSDFGTTGQKGVAAQSLVYRIN